jgi:peptide deformylase
MVLPIVCYPANVLRARCKKVTQFDETLRKLSVDMIETMHDASGVGLAAPQVGVDAQVAVIDVSHDAGCVSFFRKDGAEMSMVEQMPLVFVNPVVEPLGRKKVSGEEGCLSFPEMRGQVMRPAEVKVTYQNLDGSVSVIETDGLLARAFQHEIDHLNGILFVDRFSPVGKLSLKRKMAGYMPEWQAENKKNQAGIQSTVQSFPVG